jgi:hypothetical protein
MIGKTKSSITKSDMRIRAVSMPVTAATELKEEL